MHDLISEVLPSGAEETKGGEDEEIFAADEGGGGDDGDEVFATDGEVDTSFDKDLDKGTFDEEEGGDQSRRCRCKTTINILVCNKKRSLLDSGWLYLSQQMMRTY